MMYGKCYNMLMETNHDGNILYRCIHGIHLTEKKVKDEKREKQILRRVVAYHEEKKLPYKLLQII